MLVNGEYFSWYGKPLVGCPAYFKPSGNHVIKLSPSPYFRIPYFILNLPKTKTIWRIKIIELLGDRADSLLNHECKTIAKDQITLPGRTMWMKYGARAPDNQTLKSLQYIFITIGRNRLLCFHPAGRPGHRAQRRRFFAPTRSISTREYRKTGQSKGGCNAVASPLCVLGIVKPQVCA